MELSHIDGEDAKGIPAPLQLGAFERLISRMSDVSLAISTAKAVARAYPCGEERIKALSYAHQLAKEQHAAVEVGRAATV